MANRYYIPPRHNILDLAQLGLRLYSIQQAEKEARERQKLSKKELELKQRTEKRRERESKLEWGYDKPVSVQPSEKSLSGILTEPQPQGRQIQTRFIPGERQRSREATENLIKEREALRHLTERKALITDKPAIRMQLTIVKNKMVNFDKAYKGNTLKALEPFINYAEKTIDSENPISTYQLFKDLDRGIKMDKLRIGDELDKTINVKGPWDSRVEILAQRRDDILSGKWLRANMPECANRELLENQDRQIAEDLAKAKLMTAEASLIKAKREPTERLYPTEKGYQPREEAIGLKEEAEGKLTDIQKAKKTQLKNIADRHKYYIGQYNQATRGVGELIEIKDPNKKRVAKESKLASYVIAEEYKKLGGNVRTLGVTPEKIRHDYEVNKILSKERWLEIVRNLFPEELSKGHIADLGITKKKEYKSAEEVRDDYRLGIIDKLTAIKLLKRF